MKRRELLRFLTEHGCQLLREGGRHSIWSKPANGRKTAVPRHSEITDLLARKICRDLDIPEA
ncbi:type II toxin-antitoxin system HicA family toxin [bacterium]|nr:type II toxin-antitoxin system HicA family toxin [Verrucomicrobiota bacterium]MDA7632991.1 type II toxin-antitoxin system HicA family toxin [bacterium]